MDVHWRPYYAACSYCDLPYNFISKVFDFHNAFKPLPTLYLHLDGDGGAGHGGAVHGHAGGGAAQRVPRQLHQREQRAGQDQAVPGPAGPGDQDQAVRSLPTRLPPV